ncbi:MAG: DUF4197 domain-containing protein [Bacteroidia bacterium]|nr:DUF4197 domain-containing protein [Bacteroidia bacterium]
MAVYLLPSIKKTSMKYKILALATFAFIGALIYSCGTTGSSIMNSANGILGGTTTGGGGVPALSNDEIISGLKEALSVGANNAGGLASKADGFYKNPAIFIPWPPEAQKMKDKLSQLGFDGKIQEFETSLNRAAEEAAKGAAPIFVDAVKSMSIGDGLAILKGGDTAATHYLRDKTTPALKAKFQPVVKDAISKVNVTKYWEPLVNKYNMIPGVTKQNPNLEAYVTDRGVHGMFKLVLDEEKKIRKDPIARVSDILKKVFGSKEAGN